MSDRETDFPKKLASAEGVGVKYDLCESNGSPFVLIRHEKEFGTRIESEFIGCNDPAFPALLQDIRVLVIKRNDSQLTGEAWAGIEALKLPGADIMDVWRELIDSAV